MPTQRAHDIIRITQIINQATMASLLIHELDQYLLSMEKVGFFSCMFNTHFCPLVNMLHKTLAKPSFQMLPILIAETQALALANEQYQQQLDSLKHVMTTINTEDIGKKLQQLGTLTERNNAIQEENSFLSDRVRELNIENAQLRKQLSGMQPTHSHQATLRLGAVKALQQQSMPAAKTHTATT